MKRLLAIVGTAAVLIGLFLLFLKVIPILIAVGIAVVGIACIAGHIRLRL